MVAKVDSGCLFGLQASRIQVEVSLAKGLPAFSIVGLPDASVREAKDRVVAAVRNSGFEFPSRRVTINLAPAEIKKEGPAFDLAIAVGVLLASEAVSPPQWPRAVWLGELALDGSVRPIRGALPLVRGLSAKGWELFILPEANLREVAIIDGVSLVAARSLGEITGWLQNGQPITPHPKTPWQPGPCAGRVDLAEIKGQAVAKRALEIAAAGRHNVLFMGCPGTGKSMLAQALPSIMPAWTVDEALDASQVHSLLSADESGGLLASRPFRSPHHTTSPAALIGGGDVPMPGEISLAHRGVLFLDELPEFRRDALEALRQPLEEGWVHVNRARGRASYPSDFLLVAAMNPCPCGNRGHPKKECLCSAYRIERYLGRLSAPLVDRIDLHVELPVLDVRELFGESGQSETSGCVRERVERAWRIQRDRHARRVVRAAANARLRPHDLQRVCALDSAGLSLLRLAVDRLGLSARAFDKIRRMARTIADLDGAEAIADRHISEAVQYRALDRSRPVR